MEEAEVEVEGAEAGSEVCSPLMVHLEVPVALRLFLEDQAARALRVVSIRIVAMMK